MDESFNAVLQFYCSAQEGGRCKILQRTVQSALLLYCKHPNTIRPSYSVLQYSILREMHVQYVATTVYPHLTQTLPATDSFGQVPTTVDGTGLPGHAACLFTLYCTWYRASLELDSPFADESSRLLLPRRKTSERGGTPKRCGVTFRTT